MKNIFESPSKQPTKTETTIQKSPADEAYKRAEKSLQTDTPDPKTFIRRPDNPNGIYSQETVERDLRYVVDMQREFKSQRNPLTQEFERLAKILEAIIHEQTELSDWLGPEAHTINTSEFDDISNGIDIIIEFQLDGLPPEQYPLLAVDITSSPHTIRKKFQRIETEINNERLSTIKYFASGDRRTMVKQIPKVVIGADRKTLNGLISAWLKKDSAALANHPIQDMILEEAIRQLNVFRTHARKMHPQTQTTAHIFTQLIITLNDILKEKSRKSLPENMLKSDTVFSAIDQELHNF